MNSRSTSGIRTKDLVQLAIMAALMIVGKEVLNFIPNVHPVTLLIIVTAVTYAWTSLLSVSTFVVIELLIHGFDLWNLTYIYIWPTICIAAILCRRKESRLFWAIFALIAGLIFGILSIIPLIFTSGLSATIAFWISGIPYDLIHGASNFVIVYFLFKPLTKLLASLYK